MREENFVDAINEAITVYMDLYKKELNKTIEEMIGHFGWNKNYKVEEWLEMKNFQLLMNEDYKDDATQSTIILINNYNQALGMFSVRRNSFEFEFSDVIIVNYL